MLNILERQMLINQFKILKKTEPEDSKYYSKCIKILENGYSNRYREVFSIPDISINDEGEFIQFNQISKEQCEFVDNVLKMHRAFNDATKLETVVSFDGNDEYLYFEYALSYHEEGRYLELKIENAHAPRIDTYSKMLERYFEVTDYKTNYFKLTKAQVDYIKGDTQ